MASGREKKKQHFVPNVYLSAWLDTDAPPEQTYIWLFDKGGGAGRRKGPEKTFRETDMYTIPMPDGGRDLTIENGLQQLEQGVGVLRREFLEVGRPLPPPRHVKLMAFLAAMEARTPAFREHHRQHYNELIHIGEQMMAQVADKTVEERKRLAAMSIPGDGPTMTMDQVRELAERPIQHLMPRFLRIQVPVLAQMQTTVLRSRGRHFITSDAPVSRFDPEAHLRPFMYQSPGLAWPTVEIVLPMSPRVALLVHHTKPITKGIKPVRYVDVDDAVVDELNRRTHAFANEKIVNCKDEFLGVWAAEQPAI
ncbi:MULTISPECIES: DUF4238 domain-containing protein [Ensifer]|uniref:DUF4238 domain-containing protein n=1 Tax=Ensifer TaxID=106591 RepID=UPI0008073943|nr:DUF4238 domain-containing protein [Ensifer adhaerens]